MVDLLAVIRVAQLVLVAASVPLAVVAARGFRSAPVGRAVAALPVVSLGFLVSASAEVLGPGQLPGGPLWPLGGVVGAAGFAWLAVSFLALVSGRRQVGR